MCSPAVALAGQSEGEAVGLRRAFVGAITAQRAVGFRAAGPKSSCYPPPGLNLTRSLVITVESGTCSLLPATKPTACVRIWGFARLALGWDTKSQAIRGPRMTRSSDHKAYLCACVGGGLRRCSHSGIGAPSLPDRVSV